MAAVLAGSILAFYSYVGFETSVNIAEETKDPSRSYPRALFGALLVAGVVYALVGAAAAAVVPTAELAESSAPLLQVVAAAGLVPPVVFSVIALVAVSNGALLTGIMSSRLAYGMAQDELLPQVLTRILPRRRTPWVAILVTAALSFLLALTGTIDVLASAMVLLLLVVFLAVNAAVLVLRRDEVEQRHLRVPTVLPIGELASCLLLMTQVEGTVWRLGLRIPAPSARCWRSSRDGADGRRAGSEDPRASGSGRGTAPRRGGSPAGTGSRRGPSARPRRPRFQHRRRRACARLPAPRGPRPRRRSPWHGASIRRSASPPAVRRPGAGSSGLRIDRGP